MISSSAKVRSGVWEVNTQLCRVVLEYYTIMKHLFEQARQPGFTVESWVLLAELVAVDEFVRVGNFREVMNWQQYTEFLTRWAYSAEFEFTFKRIHEWSGIVFLELEERRNLGGGQREIVDSVSVHSFNERGKLRRLEIYLQMEPEGKWW